MIVEPKLVAYVTQIHGKMFLMGFENVIEKWLVISSPHPKYCSPISRLRVSAIGLEWMVTLQYQISNDDNQTHMTESAMNRNITEIGPTDESV